VTEICGQMKMGHKDGAKENLAEKWSQMKI
jgi:hypothetical protein